MDNIMAYERIMGIYVSDDDEYQKYRNGMMPILKSFGGSFGYDLKVSEVLRSKTEDDINRVFTLEFPSKQVMGNFFADSEYLAVKKKHFNRSVDSVTAISMHEKNT